jgi:hypothetical protein
MPLPATDDYGNFIPGAHGLPQVVMRTAGVDGIFGTTDDGTTLVVRRTDTCCCTKIFSGSDVLARQRSAPLFFRAEFDSGNASACYAG